MHKLKFKTSNLSLIIYFGVLPCLYAGPTGTEIRPLSSGDAALTIFHRNLQYPDFLRNPNFSRSLRMLDSELAIGHAQLTDFTAENLELLEKQSPALRLEKEETLRTAFYDLRDREEIEWSHINEDLKDGSPAKLPELVTSIKMHNADFTLFLAPWERSERNDVYEKAHALLKQAVGEEEAERLVAALEEKGRIPTDSTAMAVVTRITPNPRISVQEWFQHVYADWPVVRIGVKIFRPGRNLLKGQRIALLLNTRTIVEGIVKDSIMNTSTQRIVLTNARIMNNRSSIEREHRINPWDVVQCRLSPQNALDDVTLEAYRERHADWPAVKLPPRTEYPRVIGEYGAFLVRNDHGEVEEIEGLILADYSKARKPDYLLSLDGKTANGRVRHPLIELRLRPTFPNFQQAFNILGYEGWDSVLEPNKLHRELVGRRIAVLMEGAWGKTIFDGDVDSIDSYNRYYLRNVRGGIGRSVQIYNAIITPYNIIGMRVKPGSKEDNAGSIEAAAHQP